MARRTRFATGFCLALLACGDTPRAESPAASLTVPPSDAGASAPLPPADRLDPGLPKGAIWVASIDAGALADALTNPAVTKLLGGNIDLSILTEVGVDRAGSIQIAQIGLTDAQRSSLTAILAGPADFDTVMTTIGPELDPTFRIVVPVKDVAKAKAAATSFVAQMGSGIDTEITGDNGVLIIDVSFTGRSKTAKNIADLHALVKAGHAEVPARGPNEVLRATYRPSELAEVAAYDDLQRGTHGWVGGKIDPAMKHRIVASGVDAAKTILALLGPVDKSAFDRVDVIGRLAAQKLSFEVRATPGPASTVPPADAWKQTPSFAPDGAEGYILASRPFVSNWPLTGDPPNAPFTHSPVSKIAVGSSTLNMAAGLPFAIQSFTHLDAVDAGFSDAAFPRFDRIGVMITPDGMGLDIALLSKNVSAAEAACILAPTTPCPVAERLKPNAPAIAIGHRFGRLYTIKGTTQLAVALGEKASLDALKLHATMADPVDGLIPHHFAGEHGVDVPWITPAQHLLLDARLDGHVISATLTPAP